MLALELMSAEERRDRAAMAIAILGREARPAIPVLTNMLSDPELSLPAIHALSGIGPEVIPILEPLATSSDAETRTQVNKAFVQFALGAEAKAFAPRLTLLLLQNLRDEDYVIRAGAAGALVEVAGPGVAVPALMQNLQDTNACVRAMTGQALGCLGSKSKAAVPRLLELTKDEDAFVRDRVTWALRKIDPQALENNPPNDKR